MKKIKRLNVIYTPLNVSGALVIKGGSLSQTHCAETGEFVPDRSITPLVLEPSIYINDPDGIIGDGKVALSTAAWYVIPEDIAAQFSDGSYLENEIAQYLVTAATSGYRATSDGALRVECNIPYLSPVVIVFIGGFADARSGKVLRIQESVLLSTTSIAEAASLDIDKPAAWTFNPVDDSGIRTLTASFRLGGATPDPTKCQVAYWWYRVDGSTEKLVDAEDDLFYVSGQGTAVLVIDPEYIIKERLICKAEYALLGEILPTAPTGECLSAETVIVRQYPDYDFSHIVHGGVEVSPNVAEVKNECVVAIGHTVLSSASQYFSVIWSVKSPVYGAEWRVIGYGDRIMIPISEIANGLDVAVELEEFDALGAMADDDGNVITDDDGTIITL